MGFCCFDVILKQKTVEEDGLFLSCFLLGICVLTNSNIYQPFFFSVAGNVYRLQKQFFMHIYLLVKKHF